MDRNIGFVVALFMNFIVSLLSQTILAPSAVSNNAYENSLNTTKGFCRIPNDVTWRCCAMYYLRNGICQECPKGTYRFIDETECKKCSRGFYGRFCVQPCECKTGDCDPIDGTCKCERDDVECNEDLKNSTLTVRQGQVSVVIITTISVGCTAVFMLIVLLIKKGLCTNQCFGRGVNTNEVILANAALNEQPASLQEQSFVLRENYIPESHYETIDESKMTDTSNIKTSENESTVRNTHTSTLSSDSNLSVGSGVASEDTEGYLHPYNTLEENWQNKGYHYSSCNNSINKRDKL